MGNAEIKSSSPRKQELSYRNEGEELSGQTRGSACSLLAGGSEDMKVFSRPKTYAFIFKDLPLRRALFLQKQIPTSAEKLFQGFYKETSGERGLPLYPYLLSACRMNGGSHFFGPDGHIQAPPKHKPPFLHSHEGWQSHCSLLLPQCAPNKLLSSVQINTVLGSDTSALVSKLFLTKKKITQKNSGGALFIFS